MWYQVQEMAARLARGEFGAIVGADSHGHKVFKCRSQSQRAQRYIRL
jgi:hypothetical protein